MQHVDLQQIDMQRIFDEMDANPLIPIGMILLLAVLFFFRVLGKREE